MPEISRFFGIIISMNYTEHPRLTFMPPMVASRQRSTSLICGLQQGVYRHACLVWSWNGRPRTIFTRPRCSSLRICWRRRQERLKHMVRFQLITSLSQSHSQKRQNRKKLKKPRSQSWPLSLRQNSIVLRCSAPRPTSRQASRSPDISTWRPYPKFRKPGNGSQRG